MFLRVSFAALLFAACVYAVVPAVNVDPSNPAGAPSASQLQDLGAQSVKCNADCGSYLSSVSGANISALLILDYSSVDQAKPDFNAPMSQYAQLYGNSCDSSSRAYGRYAVGYEIWNEEDLIQPSSGYDPRVPPQAYALLLSTCVEAIRKNDPSKAILMGGLASGQPSYVDQDCTALGIHPYGRRPSQDWPNPNWYAKNNKRQELWVTEMGTNDMNSQGDFPDHFFEAMQAGGSSWAYGYWFCWSDGMVNPFGLVDAGGNKKPSYSSFQKFAKG